MDCRAFDEALVGLAPVPQGEVELPLAARAHAESCSACSVRWRKHVALRRALTALPPRSAPADLEGRVVAAFEAGYREDRVVASLRSIPTLGAPAELDRRVRALFSPNPAPEVLDRLVEARLESERRAARLRRGARRVLQAAGLAAAAVAVFVVLREVREDRPAYAFEIVRLDSLRDAGIDSAARGLIDGLTGGIVEGSRN